VIEAGFTWDILYFVIFSVIIYLVIYNILSYDSMFLHFASSPAWFIGDHDCRSYRCDLVSVVVLDGILYVSRGKGVGTEVL
jgi:hypothetical protein